VGHLNDPEGYTQFLKKHLPNVLSLRDIGSNTLAPLVSYALADPLNYGGRIRPLQSRLLALTFNMARKYVPYYKNYSSFINIELENVEEQLAEYPLLSRQEVKEERDNLLSTNTRYAFSGFTTGTTEGIPLIVERCQEEQAYISNLFARMSGSPPTIKPLCLVEGSWNHGSVLQVPGHCHTFVVPLEHDWGYIRAKWLLERKYQLSGVENRISRLSGATWALMNFAQYLQECRATGDINDKFTLSSVGAFGDPLPQHRRLFLESVFGCTVADTYSLSEVFGSARWVPRINAYMFEPFVYPEVIDPDTGKHTEHSTGELVLTPLFPFTQHFTILRYRTGDLVEKIPLPNSQCYAFRFRGRLKTAFKPKALGFHLGLAEVAQALDAVSGVVRPKSHLELIQENDKAQWPQVRIVEASGKQQIAIQIESERCDEAFQKEAAMAVARALPKQYGIEAEKIKIIPLSPGTLPARKTLNL